MAILDDLRAAAAEPCAPASEDAAPAFLVEVRIPGLGVWSEATADDPDGAFTAAMTLFKDCGTMGAVARVTAGADGEVVWEGTQRDALRVRP